MIRILRPAPPPAALLACGAAQLERLRALVAAGGTITSQDFSKSCYGSAAVKQWLHAAQHGKCCFCERKRGQWKDDVEHFRPKTEAVRADGTRDVGYWWLAYEPTNLFFSCQRCNQGLKGSRFPLRRGAPLPAGQPAGPGAEDALFIHFLDEDPDDHLGFEEHDGEWKLGGRTERGTELLALMDLDGDGLREDRTDYVRSFLAPLRDEWNDAPTAPQRSRLEARASVLTNGEWPHTLLARCYLRAAGIPF